MQMEQEYAFEDKYASRQSQATEQYAQTDAGESKRPQFNLKANKRFVGSGWMGDGKFGKYISFKLSETLEAGTKVYLSPRKGQEGLLG